jgi:hypothetical protein
VDTGGIIGQVPRFPAFVFLVVCEDRSSTISSSLGKTPAINIIIMVSIANQCQLRS